MANPSERSSDSPTVAAVTHWPAPAKLNLMLRITGRREDGYHTLQTVFQLLDFGDEITIERSAENTVQLHTALPGVATENNLTWRAAEALKRYTGCQLGAEIAVHKRLPMGAGLGGGSSDAATVLCALNALWGLDLPIAQLAAIGRCIGADVPVFIHGYSAWAEGIGDQLTPLQLPARWYLVVDSGEPVSTAELFTEPALTRHCSPLTIRDFLDKHPQGLIDNVFQPIVFTRYSQVQKACNWLQQETDSTLFGMSGTGGSVFAAFSAEAAAQSALARLPQQWSGFVAAGVNRSPLRQMLDNGTDKSSKLS